MAYLFVDIPVFGYGLGHRLVQCRLRLVEFGGEGCTCASLISDMSLEYHGKGNRLDGSSDYLVMLQTIPSYKVRSVKESI
jgi:hypothetical protein